MIDNTSLFNFHQVVRQDYLTIPPTNPDMQKRGLLTINRTLEVDNLMDEYLVKRRRCGRRRWSCFIGRVSVGILIFI